nr:hypothetical protein [Tanacetum cinerariifolium]
MTRPAERPTTNKAEFVKAAERPTTDKVETAKKPAVRYAELYKRTSKRSTVRGNQRNWNNLKSYQLGPEFVLHKKPCFNCGDLSYLANDCRRRVQRETTRVLWRLFVVVGGRGILRDRGKDALQVTGTGRRVHLHTRDCFSIPIGGSISPGGFLPSILLLVMIMVVVVIVAVTVILVVIVVVKMAIAIIGVVVVVGDVSSILKLSFVIIDRFIKRIASGDIVDLIGDEDLIDEDGDTEVLVSLGEISSEGKKSWESDIGDCDNTGDGGKTAGRAIIT